MSVQSTSLDAYADIAEKRDTWEQRVLRTIRAFGPISDRSIAAHIGRECGFVSARRNSLRKKGLVYGYGIEIDPVSHMGVMVWKVTV